MMTASLLLIFSMGAAPDVAAQCRALAANPPHTSIRVAAADALPASESLPAYCRIRGTIEPEIGFEARFPLADWNGRYFQAGCGGFCGRVEPDREKPSNAINHALRRGYATITTDGGHEGESLGDARWALDNPAAEAVYAHRTVPLTFEAGHRLVAALYGTGAERSYFSGCSNGGRLGAIAAQRYPELFDGIVIGCPVLNLSINGGAFGAWVLQANADANGGRILDHRFAAKLPMLAANAMEQCDALDGRADGVIANPRACTVDLAAVPDCGDEPADDCLTAAERGVVGKWYSGPVNGSGAAIFPGMPPGSEPYWGFWYLGTPDFPGVGTLLADGYGAYLGFPEDPVGYSALDFDFDRNVAKLAAQGRLFDALDTDLAAYRAAGGKLLMWHGLADPLVIPDQSRRYYEAVVGHMGADATGTFFRYFEAPGLGHCWELPASLPDQMDLLSVLERWVEDGVAPDGIAVTSDAAGSDRAVGDGGSRGTLRPYPRPAEYALVPAP